MAVLSKACSEQEEALQSATYLTSMEEVSSRDFEQVTYGDLVEKWSPFPHYHLISEL